MSSSFINPLNFIKYFQEPKYTEFSKIELLTSSFVRPYSPDVIKHQQLVNPSSPKNCLLTYFMNRYKHGSGALVGMWKWGRVHTKFWQ